MPTFLDAPRWTVLVNPLGTVTVTDLDFSRYDAYLDSLGVLYLNEEGRKVTRTAQLRPPRTDVGQTPYEQRSGFGDYFAQGDFTGGAGQRHYHRASRDETKFLESEGFDITERGELTHLNAMAEAGAYSGPHSLTHLDELVFFANGNSVTRGNGSWPGSFADEDPAAGEGGATTLDLTASGDKLFSASGPNGVHVRSAAGTWSHYQPDAATNLAVGTATKVAWLKDRLFVVGQGGTDIYEVVADSSPTTMETLPDGWTFQHIFEAGPFVFATAINTKIGKSRVHAYGLNSGGSAMEKKSSTPLPNGDIGYCGIGYLGRIFIGGGRQNASGGLEALLYEAGANETGELALQLVTADDSAASSDFSIREMEALPFAIVFGWNTGSRRGLGIYHLALNAFANYLDVTSLTSSSSPITSALYYKGRVVMTHADGLFYENLGTPVTTATLTSSIADWNTTATKTWDLFEVLHEALDVGTSVVLEYTKVDPDDGQWLTALTSAFQTATGAQARVESLRSRQLAVKITSTAAQNNAPVIRSFSVRSTPSPSDPDWELIRVVRVVDRDRKDRRAEPIKQDPRDTKNQIEDMAYRWVTLYEPGATYTVYVDAVAHVEPGSSLVSETGGTSEREAYYLELRMVGRRA